MSAKKFFLLSLPLIFLLTAEVLAAPPSPPSMTTMLSGLDFATPINNMLTWLGSILTSVIPFGIVLVMLRSVPRVINRIIMAFT